MTALESSKTCPGCGGPLALLSPVGARKPAGALLPAPTLICLGRGCTLPPGLDGSLHAR